MLGCDRRPAARASRSKRSRISWLSKPSRRNLIATARSSAGSRARYTSPIPPLSMKRSIVYLPMASGNDGGNRNSPRASRAPGRATPAARRHCTGRDRTPTAKVTWFGLPSGSVIGAAGGSAGRRPRRAVEPTPSVPGPLKELLMFVVRPGSHAVVGRAVLRGRARRRGGAGAARRPRESCHRGIHHQPLAAQPAGRPRAPLPRRRKPGALGPADERRARRAAAVLPPRLVVRRLQLHHQFDDRRGVDVERDLRSGVRRTGDHPRQGPDQHRLRLPVDQLRLVRGRRARLGRSSPSSGSTTTAAPPRSATRPSRPTSTRNSSATCCSPTCRWTSARAPACSSRPTA